MTAPKETNKPLPDTGFHQAQQIINQSIASMDDKAHIEYHSTIERATPSSRLQQWKQRLRHLLS